MLRRVGLVVLSGCLLLGGGERLQATPSGELLRAVPDSSLGLLVVNRLKDTSDRLEKLGGELQLPLPAPLAFAKAITGVVDGVDERGSLGVALFSDGEDQPPIGAIFIPVNNYAQFLAPLNARDADAEITRATFFNRPALVARKGHFAVVVDARHEELIKQISNPARGNEELPQRLLAWVESQSVAALALERGTVRLFGRVESIVRQWNQAADEISEPPRAILNMIDSLKADFNAAGLGLELADQATVVSVDGAFSPSGPSAKQLAKIAWSGEPRLDVLPAGNFTLAEAGSLPTPWVIALMHAKFAALGQPPVGEAQQQQWDRDTAELVRGLKSTAMLLHAPAAGRSVLNQTVVLLLVDDARAFLPAYEAYLAKVQKLLKESSAKPLIARVKRAELDGMAGMEITVDFAATSAGDKNADSLLATLKDKLVGTERQLNAYVVAADDHKLVVSYGSRSFAIDAAKSLRSQKLLTADPQVRQSLALLPKDRSWAGVADVAGMVQWANSVLPDIAPDARKLPAFPKALPAAASARLTQAEFDARLVLPTELLGQLGKYAVKVRKLQRGE